MLQDTFQIEMSVVKAFALCLMMTQSIARGDSEFGEKIGGDAFCEVDHVHYSRRGDLALISENNKTLSNEELSLKFCVGCVHNIRIEKKDGQIKNNIGRPHQN